MPRNLLQAGLWIFSFVSTIFLAFYQKIAESLGIAVPLYVIFILIYLTIAGFLLAIFLLFAGVMPTLLKPVMPGVVSFACLGAALLGSGAWVYFRYPGDITWSFDAHATSSFLGIGGYANDLRVSSFYATGRNNLDRRISRVSGFIRSDVTKAQFPIRFVIGGQLVLPEDTKGIPRRAEFSIVSQPFPSTDPIQGNTGMSDSQFLAEFSTFTFVFEYDGKKFVRRFTNEEIQEQFETFLRTSKFPRPIIEQWKKPPAGTKGQ